MPEPQYKRLVIALTPPEYERLAAVARRDTREPEQQIVHYIRRAISRTPKPEKEGSVS